MKKKLGTALAGSLELTKPIIQQCPIPNVPECEGKIAARCDAVGESCAQSDPINNPCDWHCVADCSQFDQKSVLVEDENGEIFRKCVQKDELHDGVFRCAIVDGTAQFEIQGKIYI